MNRFHLTAVLGLAVILPWLASAQEEAGDSLLRIRSNGRTRIEIRNGDQIALYTGGVQFDYQDYRLVADELRYSQSESFAEAMGHVTLTQAGSRLETDRLELHIDDRQLLSPGPITGQLAPQGLSFAAASASVLLSGQAGDEHSSYLIQLLDNVEMHSAEGYSFETARVSMDTGSGLVNVPGAFRMKLPAAPGAPEHVGAGPLPLGDLLLVGSSMTGQLDERMQLQSLQAQAPELRGQNLEFMAGNIRASFTDNGKGGQLIDLLASGSPVRGVYRQPGDDLNFSAETIAGTIDPGYGSQFQLSGGISLSAKLAALVSDTLSIVQDTQGVRIVFPDGLEAGMDLAELTGMEDLDLSTILHK